MATESTLIKKRSMGFSIPKSNFTLEEQLSSIENCFKNLEEDYSFLSLKLAGRNFSGYKKGKFSFFTKTEEIADVLAYPKYFLNHKFLLFLLNELKNNGIHRFFKITIKKTELIFEDILFNKKEILPLEYIENSFSEEDKVFFIDSRLFYIFKLNHKTINKKCFTFITEKELFILIERKKQSFLCSYSFN